MLSLLRKVINLKGSNKTQPIKHLKASEFREKFNQNKGSAILDVRSSKEYKSGHIKGAININVMDSKFLDRLSKFDKDQAIFVYCRSGSRSTRACKLMIQAGFSEVYNLKGGFLLWN